MITSMLIRNIEGPNGEYHVRLIKRKTLVHAGLLDINDDVTEYQFYSAALGYLENYDHDVVSTESAKIDTWWE